LTPNDWLVRLGRDHKIKEIVMVKVIEFYVPKNFQKLLNWASSDAMRKSHRVLLADKEVSLAGTEFRIDSREVNEADRT
jgi:hypothetical protein